MVPKASEDLHAYNAWRKSLVPLPSETIIRWIDPKKYSGVTQADDIKKGQCFRLGPTRKPFSGTSNLDADLVYEAIQCSAKGKLFKRDLHPRVEAIARWLDEGKIEIVTS